MTQPDQPAGRRSLEHVEILPFVEGDPVTLTCLCDCGTVTNVVVEGLRDSEQFAYTCDGCSSSHWLTIGRDT